MSDIEKLVEQTFSELKSKLHGSRNDYFGLLYLENEINIQRERAINKIAFGGNEYGIDGFHFDFEKRNFYIFQFKYTSSYGAFKEPIQQLIEKGIESVFAETPDRNKDPFINQLKSCLIDNRSIIKQVCFRFIFLGEPDEAERSQVLDKLREDLENKKYLIDRLFGDQKVTLVVEFRSYSGKVGAISDQRKTHIYNIPLKQLFSIPGPGNETMYFGLIRLMDLFFIYKDMGFRFFERNIRYGLGLNGYVNRALTKALKSILIDCNEMPEIFTFNHNGITLYTEMISHTDENNYKIVSPRVLNGAQTVTTFAGFIDANKENPKYVENSKKAKSIWLLCKIITQANQSFITNVTINNNRQNPIEPWNLHANDMIQLQIQDKFRDDLRIAYERQENAFDDVDMEEEGMSDEKPVELLKLAHTFLVSDGNIQRLANMRQVFEDEGMYNQIFNENRLNADSRHILLCYKIHLRLRKLLYDILEKGHNKYSYIPKARFLLWSLLCQAVLNDENLENNADEYGRDMKITKNFTDYLSYLATNRCRFLLSELTNNEKYTIKAAESNYSFLRTNAAFEFCMKDANNRWNWVHKKLR